MGCTDWVFKGRGEVEGVAALVEVVEYLGTIGDGIRLKFALC